MCDDTYALINCRQNPQCHMTIRYAGQARSTTTTTITTTITTAITTPHPSFRRNDQPTLSGGDSTDHSHTLHSSGNIAVTSTRHGRRRPLVLAGWWVGWCEGRVSGGSVRG